MPFHWQDDSRTFLYHYLPQSAGAVTLRLGQSNEDDWEETSKRLRIEGVPGRLLALWKRYARKNNIQGKQAVASKESV